MGRSSLLCALGLLAGCDSSSSHVDAGPTRDAGHHLDAASGEGEGEGGDGEGEGAPDAAALADAGRDAASEPDSGPPIVRREDLVGLTFNGTSPPADVAAPEFTVTAHTGEARTRADLLGHRTVMWFFPAAFTGG